MKYSPLLLFLLFNHCLFGQVGKTSDSTKIKVSETFWAKPDKVYIDSIEMDLNKTFLDPNNVEKAFTFIQNAQSLHYSKSVALITRKKKVGFVSLADLLTNLSIKKSTNIRFVIDGKPIIDTTDIRFEPSVIKKINVFKNSSNRVDHGYSRDVEIVVTTQWRKISR